MNRFKPGDKARVIGNEWVKCFNPPFWYQPDSGYIMDQDGLPVAEVRGWGTISYQDQAIDLHDQLGEDIAKGLNSVLNDEVIATQGTVPQGTEAGIPEPIEPVQEEESKDKWIQKLYETLPCTCGEVYKSRDMAAPDCPQCNYAEWIDEDIITPLLSTISRLKSEIEELKRKA